MRDIVDDERRRDRAGGSSALRVGGGTGPLALSLLLNDVPHRFVVASRDRAGRATNGATDLVVTLH